MPRLASDPGDPIGYVFLHRAADGAESVQQQTDATGLTSTGSWTTPEMENSSSSSSSSCGGAVILLSDDVIYAALGSSTAIDCRAVGTTGIYWVLPGHKVNETRALGERQDGRP